nr:MAG TPA: hypothetical protein [Caudoviricetes sp.]
MTSLFFTYIYKTMLVQSVQLVQFVKIIVL